MQQIGHVELKKWMYFRAESDEDITEESQLIRELWNIEKFAKGLVTLPKQLKSPGLKRLMERALKAQELEKIFHQDKKDTSFKQIMD